MGVFIEDLLNFGNLIDTEIEIKLSPQELKKANPSLDFSFQDSILKVFIKKKVLLWNKSLEVRLLEGGAVKKDGSKQWVFFKTLSKAGLEELTKMPDFRAEGEYLGMDVMPVVALTETYEKIPKQFRERLLINRYRIGKNTLSVYFKFEK